MLTSASSCFPCCIWTSLHDLGAPGDIKSKMILLLHVTNCIIIHKSFFLLNDWMWNFLLGNDKSKQSFILLTFRQETFSCIFGFHCPGFPTSFICAFLVVSSQTFHGSSHVRFATGRRTLIIKQKEIKFSLMMRRPLVRDSAFITTALPVVPF